MKIWVVPILFWSFCQSAWAQGLILPQIADGGGWQTAIALTNTNSNPASASLTFYIDSGGGATQNWPLSLLEVGSTQGMSIPAGATMLLHTAGAASSATTGWGELDADAGVVGYAVLTQSVAGQPNLDQEVPAAAAGSRALVPFDNTNGTSTSVTLVNTSSSGQTISVAYRTADGTLTQDSVSNVPPQGHLTFPLSQQFPALNGQSGLAEFYNANGNFSLVAQRTDSTGAAAASPVYAQTGSPILVSAGPSGGGGSLPPFTSVVITGTFAPSGQSNYQVNVTITRLSSTVVMASLTTTGVYVTPGYTVAAFNAGFGTVTLSGLTFTFGGFQAGNGGAMEDKSFTKYGITAATLTVTLSPQSVVTTGNVTGSLSLTSSLASLSGTITGTYILNP